MAKCNFSIGYTQPIENLIEKARNGIATKGGTFNGDTHSGSYSIGTFVGSISGTYTVNGNSIDFAITSKPIVVTCNKIQNELNNLINGSNYALSFAFTSEEASSGNGEKYEIGHEEVGIDENAVEGLPGAKAPFDVSVSWKVGPAGEWVEVSAEIAKITGIRRYCLCKQDDPSAHFQYILYIENTENYHYYFYDQTNDYYGLNTFRNGQHYVRYNSKQPTIVRITGS